MDGCRREGLNCEHDIDCRSDVLSGERLRRERHVPLSQSVGRKRVQENSHLPSGRDRVGASGVNEMLEFILMFVAGFVFAAYVSLLAKVFRWMGF